jgi:ADP-L-glycero-D-manno-heptose 6-epimerase
MIIITGAAGFIGSCLVQLLNDKGFYDLVLVDDFSDPEQNKNFEGKRFSQKIERENFVHWLRENHLHVQFVFHLGARTDTTEFDYALLNALNLDYTKDVWNTCVEFGLPLVYASSAATYGLGEHGYDDDESKLEQLRRLKKRF